MTPHTLFRWKSALIALIVGIVLLPSAHASASPPPLSIFDQFDRATPAGWGDTYVTSGPAQFAVNGAAGTIALSNTAARGVALLTTVSVQDIDIAVKVQPDKPVPAGEQGVYIVARSDGGGNEYRGFLRIAQGSAVLEAAHFVDGTETSLGGAVVVEGSRRGPTSAAWLRMQVAGGDTPSISLKTWVDGEAEPSEWQYSVQDASSQLPAAGAIGLGAYIETPNRNAAVVLSVDDLRAAELAQTSELPDAAVGEALPDVAIDEPLPEATVDEPPPEIEIDEDLPVAETDESLPESEAILDGGDEGEMVNAPETTSEQTEPESAPAPESIAPESGERLAPESTSTTESSTTESTSTSTSTTLSSNGMPLKDTSYYIPSGARFVATWGSDSNSGTKDNPWRTLKKAVSSASSGSTIVVRGGTYREYVYFYGKKLTIQPYPHERVWLKGSVVVTGWVSDGSIWRKDNWTYKFQQNTVSSSFIDPAYPLADYPDMVFRNGTPLKQVSSRSAVTAGKFYVDYSNNRLYVGSNPFGYTMEATALAQAMYINQGHDSVVRGLGFMHYANSPGKLGAVKGNALRLRFEDNTFAWNASIGLSIIQAGAVVRGNSFLYNGQLGLHGNKANGTLVERNRIAYNNQERFVHANGGMKMTSSRDMIWRDNLAEGNLSHGMWADISSYNVTIVRNTVRNNLYFGIYMEISERAIIASNVVYDNGSYGIYVNESGDVDIYNNTLSRNKQNIRIWEGYRENNVWDIVVRNNILSNAKSTGGGLFTVLSQDNHKSASSMGVSANYDAYYRTNASAPATLVDWSLYQNIKRFKTLSEFRSYTGQEANGIGIDNVSTNPFFVDEAGGDYSLKSGSPAIGVGVPLPQSVADAIGVSAGVPVNMGALRW